MYESTIQIIAEAGEKLWNKKEILEKELELTNKAIRKLEDGFGIKIGERD